MRKFAVHRGPLFVCLVALAAAPAPFSAARDMSGVPSASPSSPGAAAQGWGGTVDVGTGKVPCGGPDPVPCTNYDMSLQP